MATTCKQHSKLSIINLQMLCYKIPMTEFISEECLKGS